MRLSRLLLLALLPGIALAAQDPKPEIARAASTPQANGQAHTLRTIPEACARIEGRFTGQAADPYKFTLARTSANCQPRAPGRCCEGETFDERRLDLQRLDPRAERGVPCATGRRARVAQALVVGATGSRCAGALAHLSQGSHRQGAGEGA